MESILPSHTVGEYMRIEIDPNFPYVLLTAGLLAFQCIMTGFIVAGGKRGKLFTKELLESKFGEEHKQKFGRDIGKEGYPDHGSGLYADLLSFEDWYHFNIDQRVHKNFMEGLTVACVNIVILGLYWTKTALVLGIIQFVGRLIYTIGYRISPSGRILGALLVFGSMIAMMVCNILVQTPFV